MRREKFYSYNEENLRGKVSRYIVKYFLLRVKNKKK